MARFFSTLSDFQLMSEWANILDWLLDENRFLENNGWSKGVIGDFIKKVKAALHMSGENMGYICKSGKDIKFPKVHCCGETATPQIIMISASSEGRDLVRHIRKGIAHGRVNCFKQEGELWIEIVDYATVPRRKGEKPSQTAYIIVPTKYLFKIYEIYSEIERAKKSDRSKKARKTA